MTATLEPLPAATGVDAIERVLAPATLVQALAALAEPGGTVVLAGGTDLMPQSRAGRIGPARTLLNIRRIAGLDAIAVDGGRLRIGTLVTVERLLRDALIAAHAPLLAQAADHFASAQVRNAATIGGNVCNASPAGDLLPPLLALDAEVELSSLDATGAPRARWLQLADFFTGPGRTRRAPDELLTALRLPLAVPGQVVRFHKAGTRPGLDISTIAIALAAQLDDAGRLHGVRLALGAVAPTPLRALRAEALLEGERPTPALAAQAAACAAAAAAPIDDLRGSAWYRRELLRNMTERMLNDVQAA